jgi:flagellar FliL protein
MADTEEAGEEVPKKKSKLPLILGVVLALVLGGGGFFAVYSGLILSSHEQAAQKPEDGPPTEQLPDVAFVPIDPLVVSLKNGTTNRHLRFRAELEVEPYAQAEVTKMLPRVLDVLNGYLRAISIEDLEERTALIKLRAQMLRRVQMVIGEDRVRDLLIMEFVMN